MAKKCFKFVKKTFRWLYYFAEAIIALVILLSSLAFWHLYTHPMSADFLLPEISKQLLPKDKNYSLKVDSSLLYAMPNKKGIFHLNIKNLSIVRPDQTTVLSLPEVNLSYGLLHLITLNYLPDYLEILNPSVHMIISDDGTFISQDSTLESSENTSPSLDFSAILKHLMSFDKLHIVNGQVQIDDIKFNQSLSIPRFSLILQKRFGFKHKAGLFGVARIQGQLIDFQAHASLSKLTNELSLELNLPKFNPTVFDKYAPILSGIDISLSLVASGKFNTKQKHKNIADSLTKLKFQLKSLKPGEIRLPSPIKNNYSVQTLEINGGASDAFRVFKIAQSPFALTNGVTADLMLSVTGLNQFFHSWNSDDLTTILEANVYNAAMQDVPAVWPSEQGPTAHQWVKTHLSQGKLSSAYFRLNFSGSQLTDVFGDLQAQGVRVDYLPPMPAIDDVSARILLYPKKVRILANAGHIQDVSLTKADLLFHDVDTNNSWTEMTIDTQGPIQQTLNIIESPPLQLMEKFDVPYQKISGTAQTHLYLRFPLQDDLQPQEIQVQVHSDLTDVIFQTDIENLAVDNGTFQLDVTNDGLKLDGDIQVQKENLHLLWEEDFKADALTPTKYQIETVIDTKMFEKIIPDLEKYIKGKINLKTNLIYTNQKTWQGNAEINLDNAIANLYPVSRVKTKGNAGRLLLSFSDTSSDLKKGALTFDLKGDIAQPQDLDIEGALKWGEDLYLQLEKVIADGNQFSGILHMTTTLLHTQLYGAHWDISNLFDMPFLTQQTGPEKTSSEKTDSKMAKDILLDINLDSFTLHAPHSLKKIQFQAERTGKLWKTFHLQAETSKPFIVVFIPETHKFQGTFGDLGELLKYLTGQDKFKDGIISVDAKQNTNGIIQGEIGVDKITIREPGFLLQAATILGIVDAFRDKDITMDTVRLPFSIDPWHKIQLQDAYAAGSSLGVTVKGTIDTPNLDLSGSVIPAYAINSLPGKIPFLGALFRSEEGGGLIGVKYSVDGILLNPQIHFYPLSSVLPGALGRVF
ncbi:MAG: hypothetical protein J6Y85_05005 [Alphaproteobacteria bacterium]|nr:hypothetical protein [Alphaproteobacteria bacterium]